MMRTNFCNEPTLDLRGKPAFHTQSSWNRSKGDTHLGVFSVE